MDAVGFVKNCIRMCAKYDDCGECPLYRTDFCTVPPKTMSPEKAKDTVKRVEAWAAAYPVKTRQDVFLEQYPEAFVTDNGDLAVCPRSISAKHRNEVGGCATIERPCNDCQREFWMQEVE